MSFSAVKTKRARISWGVLLSIWLMWECFAAGGRADAQHQRGWQWQNPLPQGNPINCLRFAPDKLHGWAVGADGTILHTDNGGFQWYEQRAPLGTVSLYGLFVKDARTAIAVGARGTVLLTEDEGKNWQRIETGIKDHLYSVAFADDAANALETINVKNRKARHEALSFQRGWAVGSYGRIIETEDGGRTWHFQISNTQARLICVSFANERIGAIVGEGGTLLVTNDGGATWKSHEELKGLPLMSVAFAARKQRDRLTVVDSKAGEKGTNEMTPEPKRDVAEKNAPPRLQEAQRARRIMDKTLGEANKLSDTASPKSATDNETPTPSRKIEDMETNQRHSDAVGVAVGLGGLILRSENDGRTWQRVELFSKADLFTVFLYDERAGWATGEDGLVLLTGTGGRQWLPTRIRTQPRLASLQFVDASTGWAAGNDGLIIRSDDGGLSWNRQTDGGRDDLSDIFFLDKNLGWAVGARGRILITRNGGKTWLARPSETTARLNRVFFADEANGWAVGARGTIVRSTDGGLSWSVAREAKTSFSGSVEDLFGVFFVDEQRGWVVGATGRALKTEDGGVTWSVLNTGTQAWLNAVFFTDATHGIAVGSNGTIIRTEDGGATWSAIKNLRLKEWLYDVAFADKDRGYAVGAGGIILRTDDGGATWKDQESGIKTNLYSIALASANDALIVGDAGRVLQTKDGGENWEQQVTVTSAPLYGVAYLGGSAVWVAGRGGAILRRMGDVATVKIHPPTLPPVLRGGRRPELNTGVNEKGEPRLKPAPDDDIPRATPPKKP